MDWSNGFGDQRQGARRLDEGWRWAQDLSDAELAMELGGFVERYGPDNVNVGPGLANGHGVYVRDFDDILNELKEDLLNWDMGHPIHDD